MVQVLALASVRVLLPGRRSSPPPPPPSEPLTTVTTDVVRRHLRCWRCRSRGSGQVVCITRQPP